MNKKITYLIVLIALALLVFFGFLVWKLNWINIGSLKTNENLLESESLITYQNAKYGYEIKYPVGTEILGENLNERSAIIIYDKDYNDDRPYIQIEIVSNEWFLENYPNWKTKKEMNFKSYMVGNKEVVEIENFSEDCYRLLVAKNKDAKELILLRQIKKTDFLDNIFKTLVLTDGSINNLNQIEKQFSYPYVISWKEDGIDFFLTGISFGKTVAPERLKKLSGEYYNSGEEINALTLTFKIANTQNKYKCADINIRRVINEEGDMIHPNTDQFHFPGSGGCMMENNTSYQDQKVIFVVSEDEKNFVITSGGTSNVLFTINVLEADGIVREQPALELEKSIEEEGLRQLTPYNADVSSCHDASGNNYKTTGRSSYIQNWFVFGDCPRAKYYRVVPGKEMILNVKTDISSCPDCVCKYPEFSLYEYQNGNFQKTKDVSLSNVGGVLEKIYYTPNSEKIKIESNGCFYLDVFQLGENYSSWISLNSPNGGEQFELGKTYRIIWDSSEMSGNIDIELVNEDCVKGGNNCIGWLLDLNKTPVSRGIYEWKIDGLPMGIDYSKYKIHIWSNDNVYIDDYSDNYFSIVKNIDTAKPYIKLTSPVGDGKWYFEQMQTVTWESNLRGHVSVYLSFPDGGMCNIGSTLVSHETFSFLLKENMSCVIPRNITAGTYKVVLVADNDTESDYLYADGDGNITINSIK